MKNYEEATSIKTLPLHEALEVITDALSMGFEFIVENHTIKFKERED